MGICLLGTDAADIGKRIQLILLANWKRLVREY